MEKLKVEGVKAEGVVAVDGNSMIAEGESSWSHFRLFHCFRRDFQVRSLGHLISTDVEQRSGDSRGGDVIFVSNDFLNFCECLALPPKQVTDLVSTFVQSNRHGWELFGIR